MMSAPFHKMKKTWELVLLKNNSMQVLPCLLHFVLKKIMLVTVSDLLKKERDLDNKNILLHANIVWEEHNFHTFDLNMDGYEEEQNLIGTFM
jgi:hypothetical protein